MIHRASKSWSIIAATVLLVSPPAATMARADCGPVRIGVLGDSLSNEYQFIGQRDTARAWTEQLAVLRSDDFDFGEFSATRPGRDRHGYDHNWAAGTDRPSQALSEGRVLGLAGQVAAGEIDVVVVELAHVDLVVSYFVARNPAEQLPAVADAVVADLELIVDILQAAGAASPSGHVDVILINAANFARVPDAINLLPDPDARQAFTPAVMYLNARIQALGDQHDCPVLDLFGLLNLATDFDPFTVGGIALAPYQYEFFVPNPDDVFEDSQHPGSITQGLLANMVIDAVNRVRGLAVEPLSEQEIVSHAFETAGLPVPAGLTPGVTFFDVSPLVHYAATPTELLMNLAWSVACVNLVNGLSNSLDSKLDAALNALGDASERNDAAAVNSLQAFTNAVAAQRGKSISYGHAHYLMTAARSIAELLQ